MSWPAVWALSADVQANLDLHGITAMLPSDGEMLALHSDIPSIRLEEKRLGDDLFHRLADNVEPKRLYCLM